MCSTYTVEPLLKDTPEIRTLHHVPRTLSYCKFTHEMRTPIYIQDTLPGPQGVHSRGGERPNERVITVGIGWVLLASATSGFSGYIKLAYCSSAKGLQ